MKIKCYQLSKMSFSLFGDVIELPQKPDDLKKVQRWSNVSAPDFEDGKPVVDVLYSYLRPHKVTQLEMHNNSSQTFIPLGDRKFLIVVGKDIIADKEVDLKKLKAFVTDGCQGITLSVGVWHCSPLPLEENISFALLHRSPDVDLGSEVVSLKDEIILDLGSVNIKKSIKGRS